MPRGGHFAALEQPELLVADVREILPDAEVGAGWPRALGSGLRAWRFSRSS